MLDSAGWLYSWTLLCICSWLVHSILRDKKFSCKAQFHIPWIHELWATLSNSTLPHLIEDSISLGPLRSRQFNGIGHINDLLREILLKDGKEWEQDYMGRNLQLQCAGLPLWKRRKKEGECGRKTLRLQGCFEKVLSRWMSSPSTYSHLKISMWGRDILALVYLLCSVTHWDWPENGIPLKECKGISKRCVSWRLSLNYSSPYKSSFKGKFEWHVNATHVTIRLSRK